MARACVVIPTKNEAASIAAVMADVRRGFEATRYDDVVVIIADDSSDRTRAIAAEHGAYVVHGTGEGLGVAMYRGLKAAVTFSPDVIVAVDGDGQADATVEIKRFLARIEAGEADLVLGSRFLKDDLVHYHYRWINRFGTHVLSAFLRAHTKLNLTDSHGGIRAMVPDVAADLEMLGTQTYVQETILDAVEKGYRVVEIPSVWKKREYGKSRVVGSIPRYVFYTLPILMLRSGQHIRLLYSAGICLVVLAFAVFVGIQVQEGFTYRIAHRLPALVLVALLTTTGLQLFFFGFVLQLLKQIKRGVDRAPTNVRVRGDGQVTALPELGTRSRAIAAE
jgi:polyprenyl-phospho-N-acetylgalactosaminyl synthase